MLNMLKNRRLCWVGSDSSGYVDTHHHHQQFVVFVIAVAVVLGCGNDRCYRRTRSPDRARRIGGSEKRVEKGGCEEPEDEELRR